MPKPTAKQKDLFADSPLAVRELAARAAKERRAKARAEYAKANGLDRPS